MGGGYAVVSAHCLLPSKHTTGLGGYLVGGGYSVVPAHCALPSTHTNGLGGYLLRGVYAVVPAHCLLPSKQANNYKDHSNNKKNKIIKNTIKKLPNLQN